MSSNSRFSNLNFFIFIEQGWYSHLFCLTFVSKEAAKRKVASLLVARRAGERGGQGGTEYWVRNALRGPAALMP